MNTDLLVAILTNGVDRTLSSHISPPGSFSDFVSHPVGTYGAIEVAVVLQHRFAFFYWLKWRFDQFRKVKISPHLLTIDWHDDVGGRSDFYPEILTQLNPQDQVELGLFCWAGLRSNNDGHIAPAMYLDAIGDVYVILKQGGDRRTVGVDRSRSITDRNGKIHNVYFYKTVSQFLHEHSGDPTTPVILDLDLDYFTKYDGKDFTFTKSLRLVSDRSIQRFVSPRNRLMRWVLPRIAGFTIALEPSYCGGIHNCMRVLDIIDSTLFDPGLQSDDMKWRC